MSLLGNLLWLVFGGFISGAGYILGGVLLCVTIVGIPFGTQCIKIGMATMCPFGKAVVEEKGAWSTLSIIFNAIWILLFGWGIALAHILSAATLAVTIIGLPFALQHLKLVPVALLPFSHDLRAVEPE